MPSVTDRFAARRKGGPATDLVDAPRRDTGRSGDQLLSRAWSANMTRFGREPFTHYSLSEVTAAFGMSRDPCFHSAIGRLLAGEFHYQPHRETLTNDSGSRPTLHVEIHACRFMPPVSL